MEATKHNYTKRTLTSMYDATRKENEKVAGLDHQMTHVEREFEEMMQLRNEAKRRLELKFKDVYR